MSMTPITSGPSLAQAPALERPQRRWLRSAAVLVSMVVPAVLVPGWLVADPSELAEGIHLPDTIVGYLPLTDTAEEHPAGPAVLLYTSGSGEISYVYQDLAVGVDGRSYRRIDAATPATSATRSRDTFLAPDGNTVLVSDRAYDGRPLTTVDLRTGATQDIPILAGSGVLVLAWSPDLHTVALAVGAGSAGEAGSYTEEGMLTLLDLRTGTLRSLPGLGRSVVAAAWSPDGTELVVQARVDGWRRDRVSVVDTAGEVRRELALPAGSGLLPSVAWSPDGRWIVTGPYDGWGRPALWFQAPPEPALHLIDATGGGRTGPTVAVVGTTVLGWLGPDRLLQLEYTDRSFSDGVVLSALSVTDGRVTRLAGFRSNHTCEYFLAKCRTEITMQAATLLLPQLEVRPAPWLPDRGPTLLRWLLGTAVVVLWLIGLALVRIGPPDRPRGRRLVGCRRPG